jgi:hypothetical protein
MRIPYLQRFAPNHQLRRSRPNHICRCIHHARHQVLQPTDFAFDVKTKLLASHKFESYECVSEAGLSEATLFYLRVLILSQDDVKRCQELLAEYVAFLLATVMHDSTMSSLWNLLLPLVSGRNLLLPLVNNSSAGPFSPLVLIVGAHGRA